MSKLDAGPVGELALQTLAMPKDTNANGDIFGGWLVSQMDLAAGIGSKKATRGRSVTVAIQNVHFISPVSVGSTVSCFTEVVKIILHPRLKTLVRVVDATRDFVGLGEFADNLIGYLPQLHQYIVR